MKKTIQKIAGVLAITMLLLCCIALPALAQVYKSGEKTVVIHDDAWAFHGGRAKGEVSTSNGGNRTNHYNNRLYWYNGNSIDVLTMSGSKYNAQYGGKTYLYCIRHGATYISDERTFHVSATGDIQDSQYWMQLSGETQLALGRLSVYGFPARTPQQLGVSTVDDAYAATQVIAWEIIAGYNANNKGTSSYYKNYILYAYNGNGHSIGEKTPAYTAYMNIWNAIASHTTVASFANSTVTLKWDGAKYTGSVTDTKGIVANSTCTNITTGIAGSQKGNTLTFSTTNIIKTATTAATFKKNLSDQLAAAAPFAVLDASGGAQEMMCGTINDPWFFGVNVRTASGTLQLSKTSDDGVVAGVQLRIVGNGIDKTVTTGTNGKISADLPAGTYTVSEINVANRYIAPAAQNVTITDGGTAKVSFHNTVKKGFVELYKTDTVTNKALAGAVYGIYNTNGTLIQKLNATNNGGYTKSGELALGNYYLQEITAPTGCLIDETKYTFSVTETVTTIKMYKTDAPQLGKISVIKTGETFSGASQQTTEFGTRYAPQYAEKPLAGTVFQLTAKKDIVVNNVVIKKAGTVIGTVTTGANGIAAFDNLYLGDYTLAEITATTGFNVGNNVFDISLKYGGQTVNKVSTEKAANNIRQKATIQFTKEMTQNTVYANPDAYKDVRFGLYAAEDIKLDGNVIIPKDGLLAIATPGQDGVGTFDTDIPVGFDYYGKEIKTATGYVLDKNKYPVSFQPLAQTETAVALNLNNGNPIVNKPLSGYVELFKKDSVNNNPLAGAVYGVYSTDGTLIQTLDVTDSDGYTKSSELPYGEYYLQEITAPDGWLLDASKHSFKISEEETIITVNKTDAPQLGKISVIKTGEQLSGVISSDTEFGTQYAPQYVEKPLAGTEFQLTAANDIVVNNVVKIPAGTVIGTVITEADGIAAFDDLYLGDYTLAEITATTGFNVGNNVFDISLKYGGQTVNKVSTEKTANNIRQNATIQFTKEMTQNTVYANPDAYKDVRFGLYAAEDIKLDGNVIIPKDGLLAIATPGQDGVGTFDTDIPVGFGYYGKEIKTATGYVLDKNKYPVSFQPLAQTETAVALNLNNGNPIVNKPVIGFIEIIKISDNPENVLAAGYDNKPLAGAVYGVYDKDGTLIEKLDLTDSTGYAKSGELPYGEYYLQEITAPEHYLLDETQYPFTISADETGAAVPVNITVKNKPYVGSLEPHYSEETPSVSSPKTGDPQNILLWLVLFAVSAGLYFSISIRKNRE